MLIEITCPQCGTVALKRASEVNRARRNGNNLYCGKKCAGLGRRTNKSFEQKKAEKRLYDMEYRRKNRALLKAKKAAYFQRTYDPAKAAIERKKRMPKHVEYCRRPEYRAWKREYDRQYRAKKYFGEFWECFLLTQDIRTTVLSIQSDYEIRLNKDGLGKAQKRKRHYEKLNSRNPEIGPLGNPERR